MKKFNTTAVCIPSKHYMVDISENVKIIKQMVDGGKYFTINRARQYGKTTTLEALESVLSEQYFVLSLDFQDMSSGVFATEGTFVQGMSRIIRDASDFMGTPIPEQIYKAFGTLNEKEEKDTKLDELFRVFMRWFQESVKPLVLIIDEVDSATNNQIFLDFLAQLRSLYLKREKNPKVKTFQSVILSGVTDVRHLKNKIRDDDRHKVNSPWNIAADFNVDMSLSKQGIAGMLKEYEADHRTKMNIEEMAGLIYDYTSGYPFLVSRLCQLIDEKVSAKLGDASNAWTMRGMDEAVKLLLSESNTLFQTITGKLSNYPELRKRLRAILMEGTRYTYNALQEPLEQMEAYGLIRNDHNTVKISNRIFEMLLYNLFLSDEELRDNAVAKAGGFAKSLYVSEKGLNMRLILEGFIKTYVEVFGPLKDKFKEKDGRELFLLYLRPIINGTGNYYIEAQTRDQTRTDVVVDYLGEQYVIELKIWHGERYNAEGEKQISEYLDYFRLDTGYMLSFNFNQKKNQGVKRVQVGDKVLFEGML